MREEDVKGEEREAALLLRIYEAECDPQELAESAEMSLEELSRWAGRERTVRALRGLRLVADMQVQLLVSRYRLNAAAKLVSLSGQKENLELARKASVDLLKADLKLPEVNEAAAGEAEQDKPVVDEEKLLRTLRKLGEG